MAPGQDSEPGHPDSRSGRGSGERSPGVPRGLGLTLHRQEDASYQHGHALGRRTGKGCKLPARWDALLLVEGSVGGGGAGDAGGRSPEAKRALGAARLYKAAPGAEQKAERCLNGEQALVLLQPRIKSSPK